MRLNVALVNEEAEVLPVAAAPEPQKWKVGELGGGIRDENYSLFLGHSVAAHVAAAEALRAAFHLDAAHRAMPCSRRNFSDRG